MTNHGIHESSPARNEQVLSHNNAYDSPITKPFARLMENIAKPLNKYIYGPITERSRAAGFIAVNGTLTAPRLAEPYFGNNYADAVESGDRSRAINGLIGKYTLKATDGLDGPVARANGVASTFGAGFDAFVDIMGVRDDAKQIKRVYRQNKINAPGINALLDIRNGLDIAVMAVGGVANTLAYQYAMRSGADIPEYDKPKANAEAKIKYPLTVAGNLALMLVPLSEEKNKAKNLKTAGAGLLVASIVAGGISLTKYVRSAKRNILRAKEAKAKKANQQQPEKDK
jgi:hypothetical protein